MAVAKATRSTKARAIQVGDCWSAGQRKFSLWGSKVKLLRNAMSVFYSITQICSRCVNIHLNTRGPEHQQTLSAATAACECCSPENVAGGRTERRRGSVAEYPRAYDCDKEEPKVGHARGARNNGLLRRASTAHFPARYVLSAAAHAKECKREQTGRIERNSTFCWPTQRRAAARASARSCHTPARRGPLTYEFSG